MKILHISDLHDDIPDLSAFPDHLVVITGDIVNDGEEHQALRAFEALAPHKDRLIIVPGNHDYGFAGNVYSGYAARRFDDLLSLPLQGHAFAGKAPLVREYDGVTVIGLNSNLETSNPLDFASGEIGAYQLAALDEALSAARGIKVVALHHHPFMRDDFTMKLKDSAEFLWTVEGRADIVAFGHRHVPDYWRGRNGIGHILAADSTPASRRAREIVIDGGEITINTVKL